MKEFHICPVEPVIRITGFCSAHENNKPVGYFYDGESHNFWESVFIIEGRAGITAGETVYRLNAGQMIFHPPMVFHRIWNDGSGFLRYVVISFSADRVGLDKHRVCTFPSAETVYDIERRLREFFVVDQEKYLQSIREDTDLRELQRVTNRLELLFIDLLEQGTEQTKIQHDKTAELYSTAVSIMRNHIAKPLSARKIAAMCQMSISSKQKLFARYTGMGMMRYYVNLRMRYAKQLLQNGCTVGETAETLGFTDQNYFSTVYRKHFGTPPSREREKQYRFGAKIFLSDVFS